MSINYKDYEGDMCGKCVYMNMRERLNYFSDRYYCEKGEGYQPWNSRPCSKYKPDYSDERIRIIEAGRNG